MATKYEYYDTGYDNTQYCYGTAGRGQTFTPSVRHEIQTVKVYISKTNAPDALDIDIKATSAGLPTGASLASGQIAAGDVGAGVDWETCTLGTPIILEAGVMYAILLLSTGSVWQNLYNVGRDSGSATYSGGTELTSVDGGSSWSISSGSDMYFEELGDPKISFISRQRGSSLKQSGSIGQALLQG